MLYSELRDCAINAFDRITVISGYPGVGKTTAKKQLQYDGCFAAVDLDSGEFKKNPGVTDDNWVQMYVDLIINCVGYYGMKKRMKGENDKTTCVIMVSSHLEVRKLLNERGIPFIYVKPADKDMADYLTEFVIEPREHSENEGDQRAAAFAKRTVEAYRKGEYPKEPDMENQLATIELDTFNSSSGKVYYHMLDVIYAITKVPFDYRNKHAVKPIVSKNLQIALGQKIENRLRKKNTRNIRNISTLGISSHGEVYAIFNKKGTKTALHVAEQFNLHESIAEKLANRGTGHILLARSDAEAILRMLNSAIERLESGTREDNDIEVFGDDAISYERLIDELDYTCLAVWRALRTNSTSTVTESEVDISAEDSEDSAE